MELPRAVWLLLLLYPCICSYHFATAEKNHFDVLQVNEYASTETIKKHYKDLARQYHPDKNSKPDAAETFTAIAEAYTVLSDPNLRAEYEAFLKSGRTRQSSNPASRKFRNRNEHVVEFDYEFDFKKENVPLWFVFLLFSLPLLPIVFFTISCYTFCYVTDRLLKWLCSCFRSR
jgi:hypothetical protein